MLLPCTLWLLFQPSSMQVGVAIAVLVFSTFVVSATRKLSDALEKAFRLTRQMERAHTISTRAAQTDELTGLMNRRAFSNMPRCCTSNAATTGNRCAR